VADGATGGIKGRANGLFEGLFAGSVGFHNRRGCLAQTMDLASLMADTGKDPGYGHLERLLIVTDDAANSIAQRFDGLKHLMLQGLVPRRQYRSHLQHRAELQFPHDIQRPVPFLWLEGIDREKKAMAMKVRRVLDQPQAIGAPEQHEKDAD
jgi:hypothetical protein